MLIIPQIRISQKLNTNRLLFEIIFMKNIYSYEFIEQINSWKKEFTDINLQYSDIPQMDFKDIIIKDSRLFFVTFNDCNFLNVKFINCEIIYPTFYRGSLDRVIFEKCSMQYALFDSMILRNSKIHNSKTSWTGIFSPNPSGLDVTSSENFKMFTDVTQFTQNDLEELMRQLGPVLDQLDISIRAKIKDELKKDASKFGLNTNDVDITTKKKNQYDQKPVSISDIVISAYNSANPYKSEIGYKSEVKYK